MNEIRLSLKQWIATFLVLLVIIEAVPLIWRHVERFDTGPDYRIPYSLSKDYWLFNRRMRQVAGANNIIVLGDSVVWGEYVLPDGTLSHFLNAEAGTPDRFINGGINGLFPLAEEGLIKYYGQPLRNQKILLHCNLLWMTSPKADLSTAKRRAVQSCRPGSSVFSTDTLLQSRRQRTPDPRCPAASRLLVVDRTSAERFL